jgi:hypothetical protein
MLDEIPEIPEFVDVVDNHTLKVRVADWSEKPCEYTVNVEDVVEYFAYQACDMLNGVRNVGAIYGDWRYIDELAHILLDIFKQLDIEYLRRVSRQYGLIPKF